MSFTRPTPQPSASVQQQHNPPTRTHSNSRAAGPPPSQPRSAAPTPSGAGASRPQASGPSSANRASAEAVKGAMDAWVAHREAKVTNSLQRLQAQDRRVDENVRQQRRYQSHRQSLSSNAQQLLGPSTERAGVVARHHEQLPSPSRFANITTNTNAEVLQTPTRALTDVSDKDSASRFHTPQSSLRPGEVSVRMTSSTTTTTTTVTATSPSRLVTLPGQVGGQAPGSSAASSYSTATSVSIAPFQGANSTASTVASAGNIMTHHGRVTKPDGTRLTIDDVAKRKKKTIGNVPAASGTSGGRHDGRSDPARVLLNIFAPLGLLMDTHAAADDGGVTQEVEALVSLLESWLGRTAHLGRDDNHHRAATADGGGDSRRLELQLWTALHRTVFYCVHVLTPSASGSVDADKPRAISIPKPLSVKLAPGNGLGNGTPGKATPRPEAGAASRGYVTTSTVSYSSTSTVSAASSECGIAPQGWFFVCYSLVEMGYPRSGILTCVPPRINRNDTSLRGGADVLLSYVPEDDDGDATSTAVHELILALLWLARRYQLAAVAELVLLRQHAAFLFDDAVEGEELRNDSIPPSAATHAAKPPSSWKTHTDTLVNVQYPVGEGWGPWCQDDAAWLQASHKSRASMVAARVARCQAELSEAAAPQVLTSSRTTKQTHRDVNDTATNAGAEDVDDGYTLDDGRSSRLAAWKSSRHVLQLHTQVHTSFQQIEGLLLRRAELVDVLGSSHSMQDYILCLPEHANLYQQISNGLAWWRDVPLRCARHRDALTGFANILVSLHRANISSARDDEGRRQLEAIVAEDAPLLAAAQLEVARHRERSRIDASQQQAPSSSSASDVARGAVHHLEDHVFPEDRGYCAEQPLPTFGRGSAITPTTTSPVLTDDLGDLLRRYHRTDAHEYFESKKKWLHAVRGQGRARQHAQTSTNTFPNAAADAVDELISSIHSSVRARYSLPSALAAQVYELRQQQRQHLPPAAAAAAVETDAEDVDAPLSPQLNYNVIEECFGLLPPSRASRVMATAPQPVFVGPPGEGRTTSARVEIHRLQQILDAIQRHEDAADTPQQTEEGSAASQRSTTGQSIVPRARRAAP